jgi:glycosyltransferase involved in cell wall biosynthesis
MRILALPAFRNRALNPYNALLYEAIVRLGVTVDEASVWRVIRAQHDVLHIHWPEYVFNAPTLAKAVAKSVGCVLLLSGLRVRKTRVVWTIHNLHAHERWHTRLETRMWRWFVRHVDGYIALSAVGEAAALARYPELERRPGFVIPHGHYRDEYPDEVSREAARDALGLPRSARVVAFLGALRPYKNVPALLAAFRGLPGDDWRLVVAGQPLNDGLRTEIERGAGDDGRIRLDLAFVPRDQVQLYARAADLLVFPYRDILNSGSALLALSFDRPILVPDRGAMAELRRGVGDEWVRTYDGELTTATLGDAVAWAEATPRDAARLLRDLDWDEIARQTVDAYDAVRRCSEARPRVWFGAEA